MKSSTLEILTVVFLAPAVFACHSASEEQCGLFCDSASQTESQSEFDSSDCFDIECRNQIEFQFWEVDTDHIPPGRYSVQLSIPNEEPIAFSFSIVPDEDVGGDRLEWDGDPPSFSAIGYDSGINLIEVWFSTPPAPLLDRTMCENFELPDESQIQIERDGSILYSGEISPEYLERWKESDDGSCRLIENRTATLNYDLQ